MPSKQNPLLQSSAMTHAAPISTPPAPARRRCPRRRARPSRRSRPRPLARSVRPASRRPACAPRPRRRNRRRPAPATKAHGTRAWRSRNGCPERRGKGQVCRRKSGYFGAARRLVAVVYQQLLGDVREAPGPELTRPDAEVVGRDAHQLGRDVAPAASSARSACRRSRRRRSRPTGTPAARAARAPGRPRRRRAGAAAR